MQNKLWERRRLLDECLPNGANFKVQGRHSKVWQGPQDHQKTGGPIRSHACARNVEDVQFLHGVRREDGLSPSCPLLWYRKPDAVYFVRHTG